MAHTMSRAQRRAAFLECATQMFDALEDWYDAHPDANFGEIFDNYLIEPGVLRAARKGSTQHATRMAQPIKAGPIPASQHINAVS